MKLAWKVLVLLGIALMVLAFNLNTTVYAGDGQWVHNIGLQSRQQMILMLGGFCFLGGVIIFATAKVKQTPEEEQRDNQKGQEAWASVEERLKQILAGLAAFAAPLLGRPRLAIGAIAAVVVGLVVLQMWNHEREANRELAQHAADLQALASTFTNECGGAPHEKCVRIVAGCAGNLNLGQCVRDTANRCATIDSMAECRERELQCEGKADLNQCVRIGLPAHEVELARVEAERAAKAQAAAKALDDDRMRNWAKARAAK